MYNKFLYNIKDMTIADRAMRDNGLSGRKQ